MTDCIFCNIIKGEIPSKKVYEDKDVYVFHDIAPKAPVHILVVSKKHMESLRTVSKNDSEILGKLLLVIKDIAVKAGISQRGYKVVINNGPDSGQLVDHLHFHVLGGWSNKVNWEV